MNRVRRTCHSCGNILSGRSDKKFCSHYCRNDFHNDEQKFQNKNIRKVGHILRRNQSLIKGLLSFTQNKTSLKLSKSILFSLGFNPNFHTHSFTTRDGKTYFFCYDHAFHDMGEKYHIVREDEIKKPEILYLDPAYN